MYNLLWMETSLPALEFLNSLSPSLNKAVSSSFGAFIFSNCFASRWYFSASSSLPSLVSSPSFMTVLKKNLIVLGSKVRVVSFLSNVQSLAAGEVFLERVSSFSLALFWALFRSFVVLA